MSLAMTTAEEKIIDAKIEGMLDWASSRQVEAEQLSLDAVRLLSCAEDRLDKVKNQGFFKRCWSRFSGEAGAAERANIGDLTQMQKHSLRYINMLQERQMVMAHTMLSLKNNLYTLAIQEEETRNLVALLAKRTLERFEKLEDRVDKLEISSNLQGWLLSLEERDYKEKIKTPYMRLFRVINDFYSIKNDGWHYTDLLFMRKAIRTVGLDPKEQISLNVFIGNLTDEIQQESVGFDSYGKAIALFRPQHIDNYSDFILENISSPVFMSLHELKRQYMDRREMVEELIDQLQISQFEALKRLLRRSIANVGVNLDYQFPLAETAIEILGCLRLTNHLLGNSDEVGNKADTGVNSSIPNDIDSIVLLATQLFVQYLSNSSLTFQRARQMYFQPPKDLSVAETENQRLHDVIQKWALHKSPQEAEIVLAQMFKNNFLSGENYNIKYVRELGDLLEVLRHMNSWLFSGSGIREHHDSLKRLELAEKLRQMI